MRSPFTGMWGLSGIGQAALLSRYSLGGKAPAVIADPVAGVYGLGGRSVGFDGLFTFSRLSAAWKLNALGHWVKVLAGEPRIGHHVWKGGKLVPAGIAACSKVRTNYLANSNRFDTGWNDADVDVTPNTHISPDGTMNADTLTRSGEQGYLIKSAIGVNGQTKSIYARTVSGTGTVGLLSHNSVPASEMALTEEWQEFDLPVDTAETGGSNFYAVDFRIGDLTEIVVWMAQLKDGPYTTDLIPTDVSTVSIAAETLEIDPVKLVKAVGVFGPELIANNDFSDDLTGWVSASDGILSVTSDGLLSVANLPDDLAGFATQQFATELDELYLVEIDIANVTNRRVAGISTSQSGDRDLLDFGINNQIGKFSGFFTGTGGNVHMQLASFDLGATTLYRSATVRKVTMPEALTFVIKGFMTYEDGDQWDEVVPVEIGTLGAGINYLAMGLGTTGGLTGQMRFLHRSDGGWSTVLGPDDKAPGVHVPFSYAQTVGNGLNQGASDGVLSSAASPASIANILGQILHLAKRGDFCLTEFAIYVGNPGADALQEATS